MISIPPVHLVTSTYQNWWIAPEKFIFRIGMIPTCCGIAIVWYYTVLSLPSFAMGIRRNLRPILPSRYLTSRWISALQQKIYGDQLVPSPSLSIFLFLFSWPFLFNCIFVMFFYIGISIPSVSGIWQPSWAPLGQDSLLSHRQSSRAITQPNGVSIRPAPERSSPSPSWLK